MRYCGFAAEDIQVVQSLGKGAHKHFAQDVSLSKHIPLKVDIFLLMFLSKIYGEYFLRNLSWKYT